MPPSPKRWARNTDRLCGSQTWKPCVSGRVLVGWEQVHCLLLLTCICYCKFRIQTEAIGTAVVLMIVFSFVQERWEPQGMFVLLWKLSQTPPVDQASHRSALIGLPGGTVKDEVQIWVLISFVENIWHLNIIQWERHHSLELMSSITKPAIRQAQIWIQNSMCVLQRTKYPIKFYSIKMLIQSIAYLQIKFIVSGIHPELLLSAGNQNHIPGETPDEWHLTNKNNV